MPINRRQLIGLFSALAAMSATGAWADGDHGHGGRHDRDDDYNEAYKARRSGDIMPLRDILAAVRSAYPGEIVGIEFEREDGRPVYEVKILQVSGRYLDIYVNARTGVVIKVEGK